MEDGAVSEGEEANNFAMTLCDIRNAENKFQSEKKQLDEDPKEGNHESCEVLKREKLRLERDKKKAALPSAEEMKQEFTAKNFHNLFDSNVDPARKEKLLEEMVVKKHGKNHPNVTPKDKRQCNAWKNGLSEQDRNHFDDDEKEANQVKQIRCIHDEACQPCFQGMCSKPGDRSCATVTNLNPKWEE